MSAVVAHPRQHASRHPQRPALIMADTIALLAENVPADMEICWAAKDSGLYAHCRDRLSAIKCPRSVDFVAQLPRSAAGKLLKRQINAPYWEGRQTLIV